MERQDVGEVRVACERIKAYNLSRKAESFKGSARRMLSWAKHKNNILSASILSQPKTFRQLQLVGVKGNLLPRSLHFFLCVAFMNRMESVWKCCCQGPNGMCMSCGEAEFF